MNETKQDDLSRAAGKIEMEAFLEYNRLTAGHSTTPHFPYHIWPALYKIIYVKKLEDRWKVLLLFCVCFPISFQGVLQVFLCAQVFTRLQVPQG